MSTKYRVQVEGENGWTNWINLVDNLHSISCCDCGLVHNLQFRVVIRHDIRKDGSYQVVPLKSQQFAVQFRAQRNNLATAARRRSK